MNGNRDPRDFRATLALTAFVLFAFVLLAALLAPGSISLLPVLPALIELLRLTLDLVKPQ